MSAYSAKLLEAVEETSQGRLPPRNSEVGGLRGARLSQLSRQRSSLDMEAGRRGSEGAGNVKNRKISVGLMRTTLTPLQTRKENVVYVMAIIVFRAS
jgi:hypothetical protein